MQTLADEVHARRILDLQTIPKFFCERDFVDAIDGVADNYKQALQVRPFAKLPYGECWLEARFPTPHGSQRVGFMARGSGGDFDVTIISESFRGTGKIAVVGTAKFEDMAATFLPGGMVYDAVGAFRTPPHLTAAEVIGCFATRFMVALALLNTQNVGSTVFVDHSGDGTSVVRRRLGKQPRFSYHLCRIQERVRRLFLSHAGHQRDLRAHFVRGHFKQRKTGVFWWSPYVRGKLKNGFVEKDYAVA